MKERLTERKLRQTHDTLWIMKERAKRNGKTEEAELIGRVMGCVTLDMWGLAEGFINGRLDEKLEK